MCVLHVLCCFWCKHQHVNDNDDNADADTGAGVCVCVGAYNERTENRMFICAG